MGLGDSSHPHHTSLSFLACPLWPEAGLGFQLPLHCSAPFGGLTEGNTSSQLAPTAFLPPGSTAGPDSRVGSSQQISWHLGIDDPE